MTKLSLLMLAGALTFSANTWAQNAPVAPGSPNDTSWSGRLADANCKATTPNDRCEVGVATKSYGIETADGKFMKLDTAGNDKVQAALQSKGKMAGTVNATIHGSMDGDSIKVDKVDIR